MLNLLKKLLITTLVIIIHIHLILGVYNEEEIMHLHDSTFVINMSCENFIFNTTFDPKSILDNDWKIFYFWNLYEETSYNIRFSLPTKILVDHFKMRLEQYDGTINWTAAAFFMETSIDFSALYISTDVPGLYRVVPSVSFELEYIPKLKVALKVVEPGYLGIMNCKDKMCYALAPVDKMPEKKDLTMAAMKIGFVGGRNYSYLIQYAPAAAPVAPYAEDDSEEDEQVQLNAFL